MMFVFYRLSLLASGVAWGGLFVTSTVIGDISADGWLLIIGAVSAGLVAVIGAIGKAFVDINRLRNGQANLKDDYDAVWLGIAQRGYVEAVKCGHIMIVHGKETVSDSALKTYEEVKPQLSLLLEALRHKYHREPTRIEYSWAVEQDKDLQRWMLTNACPSLQMDQHGCLAVAHLIAVEADEK